MTTVAKVMEYLRDVGELAVEAGPPPDLRISGPAPESSAGPGTVSWLSTSRLHKAPERISAFGGALLICPADVPGGALGNGWAAPCRRPKLAFSLVLDRFFPELSAWPWPTAPATRGEEVVVASSARLAPGVVLGNGVTIEDDVEVGPYTVLAHTTVRRGTRIGASCSIGLAGFGFDRSEDGIWFRFPHVGRVEIGPEVEIGSNTCIDRGALGATTIGRGVKIDNQVHVAHNVEIAPNSLIIAHAMLGGSVKIDAGVWVAPSAVLKNQITIGAGALIGLGAVVLRDVEPGATIVGNPGKPIASRSST